MFSTNLPAHLLRLALVYVRQSSPHQTLVNRESLELQYNLRHKASAAGWAANQIRIIGTDLGRTARTAEGRPGFQELVTLVNQEPPRPYPTLLPPNVTLRCGAAAQHCTPKDSERLRHLNR